MATRLLYCVALGVALGSACLALGSEHGSSPAAEAPEAATQGGHGGGHSADLNPLDFKTDTALWTGVLFVVLFLVLARFAWKPIAEGLEKRERQVADQISSAEKANQDARQLLADYQQKLAASGDEVRQILDAARRDAERVGHEIVEKARGEAQAEHQRALREIDNATAGALKELAERSATLAVELAGRIVASKLDPAEHRRLIDQAVNNFAREPSSN